MIRVKTIMDQRNKILPPKSTWGNSFLGTFVKNPYSLCNPLSFISWQLKQKISVHNFVALFYQMENGMEFIYRTKASSLKVG